MLTARADERVLGYLGRALSLELSAVQLYSTQASLVSSWGLSDAGDRLRKESEEELGHANRIIERMLALGVAPNASQLRPVQLGRSLTELLMFDAAFERELVGLYQQAAQHCASVGDHDNRQFFETLLDEEMEHDKELTEWISQLQQGATPAVAENTSAPQRGKRQPYVNPRSGQRRGRLL